MDLETRIEFVELYFTNGKSASSALRAYKIAHGCHRDPFSVSTISRLIQRFRETGSVAFLMVIEQIDSDELRRSVLHLPSRLQAVIESGGEAIEKCL